MEEIAMSGQVAVSGNLTKAPHVGVVKEGKNAGKNAGKAFAQLDVAENTRVRDADGVWSDGPTKYHSVFATGRLAENIAASNMQKGSEVLVAGYESEPKPWNDAEGVEQPGKATITANTIGAGLSHATVAVTPTKKAEVGADPASVDVANPSMDGAVAADATIEQPHAALAVA
jgi:single-stranded DNA-binding protein